MADFMNFPAAGAPLIANVLQQPIPMQTSSNAALPPTDMEKSFSCAHCGATQVTGLGPRTTPRGAGMSDKRKVRPARPRSAVIDGQKVLLCNACGIYWQRKGQKRPLKPSSKRNQQKKKVKSTASRDDSVFFQIVSELYPPADGTSFLRWCC